MIDVKIELWRTLAIIAKNSNVSKYHFVDILFQKVYSCILGYQNGNTGLVYEITNAEWCGSESECICLQVNPVHSVMKHDITLTGKLHLTGGLVMK